MLRRQFLKTASLISSALLTLSYPFKVLAEWNKKAFSTDDQDEAIREYYPGLELKEDKNIILNVRSEIENGGVVPIEIKSDLPNIKSISIFVKLNPNPLICSFKLQENSIGAVATRIKMEAPSEVMAVVESNDVLYFNKKFVKVAEGGCS